MSAPTLKMWIFCLCINNNSKLLVVLWRGKKMLSFTYFECNFKVASETITLYDFLKSTSPAHKYYLAMDPIGEVLYVSDTTSRRVYRVRNLGQPKDPSRNLEVVAGTGEQCLPFDQSHCGEGRKATEAALNNPRGTVAEYEFLHLCFGWLSFSSFPSYHTKICCLHS